MTNAERQSLTREVNDHIRGRFMDWDHPGTRLDVLCECGTCTTLAETTLADYDRLRSNGFLTLH